MHHPAFADFRKSGTMINPGHFLTMSLRDIDDPDLLTLTVHVVSGHFSGKASCYVGREQIENFIPSLKQFPIDALSPPKIKTGFGKKDGTTQRPIAIQIIPYDGRGRLLVEVCLSNEYWNFSPHAEGHQCVTASFFVEYQAVAEFSPCVAALLAGDVPEASLIGSAREERGNLR